MAQAIGDAADAGGLFPLLEPRARYRIFAGRLERSYTAVEYFALILRECGFLDVFVPPIVRDGEGNVAGGIHDEGDVFYTEDTTGLRRRVEVKHQPTTYFTGWRDWPYKPRYVVCNVAPWERASPKPIAVIRFNGPMTHFGCVPAETRAWWTQGWQIDGKKGTREWAYFAPPGCVIWVSL